MEPLLFRVSDLKNILAFLDPGKEITDARTIAAMAKARNIIEEAIKGKGNAEKVSLNVGIIDFEIIASLSFVATEAAGRLGEISIALGWLLIAKNEKYLIEKTNRDRPLSFAS